MAEFERSVWDPSELDKSQRTALEGADNAVWFLPERIYPSDGTSLAGFRDEVQELRAELLDQGLQAGFLTPKGARKSRYSEHSAEWVLPTVLTVANLPIGVLSAVIADRLIRARSEDEDETQTVRYREINFDPSADRFELIEADGPVEDVARLLRERANSVSKD